MKLFNAYIYQNEIYSDSIKVEYKKRGITFKPINKQLLKKKSIELESIIYHVFNFQNITHYYYDHFLPLYYCTSKSSKDVLLRFSDFQGNITIESKPERKNINMSGQLNWCRSIYYLNVKNKTIVQKKEQIYHVKELIIADCIQIKSKKERFPLIQKIRQNTLSKLQIKPEQKNIGVYGRNDAKTRKMINYKELLKTLKHEYSEQLIELETLSQISFEEQVKTFSQFKILITSTGANTVNCIFMPRKSQIIDISPGFWADSWLDKYGPKQYFKYYELITKKTIDSHISFPTRHPTLDHNFVINTKKVIQLLKLQKIIPNYLFQSFNIIEKYIYKIYFRFILNQKPDVNQSKIKN